MTAVPASHLDDATKQIETWINNYKKNFEDVWEGNTVKRILEGTIYLYSLPEMVTEITSLQEEKYIDVFEELNLKGN